MQVFELYFNPKNETKISESFHYKPKDVYEGRLGRIYMVGEITNPEKKDYPFLQNIFHVAREKYYYDASLTPEKALKETLKEVNDFIREKKYGGKFDIVFLASKNFAIYLGKIGRTKVFLASNGSIKDIGEELENTGSNFFCNMVSGKMKKADRLLILTTEIYNFFKKEKILEEVVKDSFGEKSIEKISLLQQEKYKDVVGVALIMDHTVSLKETKVISKMKKKRFSFKQVLFHNTLSFIKIKFPKIKLKLPSFKKPSFTKKSLFLPLLLLGVILLGSAVIGIENNIRFGKQREQISLIEEKISHAKKEGDLFLMKEAFLELEYLMQEKIKFHEEVIEMHFSLEEELFALSLREDLEEMELIGKINEIVPDKIIFQNEKIYLFSSTSPLMAILNPLTKEEISYPLPIEKGVDFSSLSGNQITLFAYPNNLVFIDNEIVSNIKINLAHENQEYLSLSSFLKRPYFLDKEGNIFRYTENSPTSWIKEGEALAEQGISLAIDGSIFVLTFENKILRYHEGEKKEIIDPFIFPSLSSARKIYTSPESPIFILDPEEKRIVVINKNGSLVKQIFHEKFAELKDLTIDGKKIYLLINQEVYSVDF